MVIDLIDVLQQDYTLIDIDTLNNNVTNINRIRRDYLDEASDIIQNFSEIKSGILLDPPLNIVEIFDGLNEEMSEELAVLKTLRIDKIKSIAEMIGLELIVNVCQLDVYTRSVLSYYIDKENKECEVALDAAIKKTAFKNSDDRHE